MQTRSFEFLDQDSSDFQCHNTEKLPSDSSPATKLERRRRIEDIVEERRLREELREFG